MKKYFLLIAILLIIIVVLAIKNNNEEYTVSMSYFGKAQINDLNNFNEFTYCYLISDNNKEDMYSLRHYVLHMYSEELYKDFVNEFENELNSNKYYISSYGRKIKNIKVLFKYDGDDTTVLNDYYYGSIEYEEAFKEGIIYVYEVSRSDVIYQEMTTIDSFGEDNQIQLVVTNQDTVNINVFREGNINPLYEQNNSNRYDVTTEVKVYYYKYEEPFLYAINKWGRYIVINTSNSEIAVRTTRFEDLPDEYKKMYGDMDSFNDISNIDDIPKDRAIEFGDGTIYLQNVKGTWILKNESQRVSILYDEAMVYHIVKYSVNDNLLFLIDEENKYYIIDIAKYEMLYEAETLKELPTEFNDILNSNILFIELELD